MREWLIGPENVTRITIIRMNPVYSTPEVWDFTSQIWVALGPAFAPTQLGNPQPYGKSYSGQVVLTLNLPDDALVTGAAVLGVTLDSHGNVASLVELRTVYHSMTVVLP